MTLEDIIHDLEFARENGYAMYDTTYDVAIHGLKALVDIKQQISDLKSESSFDHGEGVRDCWRIFNRCTSEVRCDLKLPSK